MQSVQNNEVFLLHFPGSTKKIFKKEMWEIANTQKIILPKDLSIVSLLTTKDIKGSPLHYQLTNSNMKYYNADNVDKNKPWHMGIKPRLVYEALQKVSTKYCLILDSLDMVFCGDIQNLLPSFLSYDKDIIFCSNLYKTPLQEIEKINGCPTDKERQEKYGKWCYLQAGSCIGITNTLKEFYQIVADKLKNTPMFSEQPAIRETWNLFMDKMFVDYKCKIFQLFCSGVTFSQSDLNKIILEKEYRR